MAIEDILKALEEQAQTDIDAVLDEAKSHADLIVGEAQEEAGRRRAGFEQQVERVARGQATKVVNAARLDAKMTVSSARGEGVDEVFMAAASQLAAVRQESHYAELFGKLAEEALEGTSGEIVVRVDPADESMARETIARMKPEAQVVADLSSAGGLIVEASGGRVVRRNTLEDRLERARQYQQAEVARVLYA